MNHRKVIFESNAIIHLLTFGKAQVSAFLGGLSDLGLMFFLTEVFGIHYLVSLAGGGVFGAFINFYINRKWTFQSGNNSLLPQVFRFSIAVLTSILMKSIGTFIFTEWIGFDYKISRIITDGIVCFGINYPLQKLWVFGKS